MLQRTITFLCFLLPVLTVQAQLCQGSLGDPIVNITFGAGANPGAPLSAAATNYQYTATNCPADGFYTVRNSTGQCYSWNVLNADHTGDPNGYFMLVNASYQPSAFYVDTVNLFCSNTTYEFAAWVVNMNKPTECNGSPIQPNLTFNIEKTDGTVIQTYNTGNIPPQNGVAWTQYGFFFTAPTSVSTIVLRITNNAQGGCGNDLALDDITFRACGPMISSSISNTGASEKDLCQGDSAQVTLSSTISPGYDQPYFQWQRSLDQGATWTDIPGANSLSLVQNFPSTTPVGRYLYRMSVSKIENSTIAACRVNSGVLTVKVNASPTTAAMNNGPACEKGSLTLSATGGSQYAWHGVNGFSASGASVVLDPVQIAQQGKYYVQVTNDAGCTRTDSTVVAVNPTPTAIAQPDKFSICQGDTAFLHSSGGSSYIWSPSTGLSSSTAASPYAAPTDTVRYLVAVSNSYGCKDSAYVQVNVMKKPTANAGPDKNLLVGQTVQLSGAASGTDISFYWSPPDYMDDIHALQPNVHPPADMAYMLHVLSGDGCGMATDTVFVHVFKGIYVPNAFTPNHDGLNDYWNIPGLNIYQNYEIFVFNRWGQLVYRSKNIGAPWDGTINGKAQPTGTYCYLIDIKDISVQLTGSVTIIR